MRAAARRLAAGIDLCIDLQEQLIELAASQRASLVDGLQDVVDARVRTAEVAVLRLSAAEAQRQAAAEELADELGVRATRWSALRVALEPDEVAELAPRIEQLEVIVRELELANAVNSQIVMRELDLVDVQIRGMSPAEEPRNARGYTDRGDRATGQGTAPMLLNTIA